MSAHQNFQTKIYWSITEDNFKQKKAVSICRRSREGPGPGVELSYEWLQANSAVHTGGTRTRTRTVKEDE